MVVGWCMASCCRREDIIPIYRRPPPPPPRETPHDRLAFSCDTLHLLPCRSLLVLVHISRTCPPAGLLPCCAHGNVSPAAGAASRGFVAERILLPPPQAQSSASSSSSITAGRYHQKRSVRESWSLLLPTYLPTVRSRNRSRGHIPGVC